MPGDPVLIPITLDSTLETYYRYKIGGYTGAPLSLQVGPMPHVGFTKDMRDAASNGRRVMVSTKEDAYLTQVAFAVKWPDIRRFKA